MSRINYVRSQQKRNIGNRVLIICEGEKTELYYFEAIRKYKRISALQIRVIKPPNTDPLGIVKRAITERTNALYEKRWTDGDVVWSVFDGDEHRLTNPDNWNSALQLAQSNSVNLAISNPSFELWYLLHFRDVGANFSRTAAKKALEHYVNGYEKHDILFPKPLLDLTNDACIRAQQLLDRCSDVETIQYCNPSTSVCHLVKFLLNIAT